MRNQDKQDEAQRHAQRDALISIVFRTIVHDLNKSCEDAYILIGRIWGLGERQIQKILKHADESALGADDFVEFVVILQRILKESDKSIRRKQITTAPSSLHVRTFVTECRPSSLYHVFAQGRKHRRSARHTLNAGVTKAG